MVSTRTLGMAGVLLVGLAVAPLPARAGQFIQIASNACMGARWTDERALLRTPEGLSNESDRAVTVVCSWAGYGVQIPPNGEFQVTRVHLRFWNHGSRHAHVTCLMTFPGAAFVEPIGPVRYRLPAAGTIRAVFVPTGTRSAQGTYSVACTLPPRVEMTTIEGWTSEWKFEMIE